MEFKKVSGFLNDHAKVKAFIVGFYSGLTEWKGMDSDTMQDPNVVKYPYYARFAFSLATLERWGLIIAGYNIVTGGKYDRYIRYSHKLSGFMDRRCSSKI